MFALYGPKLLLSFTGWMIFIHLIYHVRNALFVMGFQPLIGQNKYNHRIPLTKSTNRITGIRSHRKHYILFKSYLNRFYLPQSNNSEDRGHNARISPRFPSIPIIGPIPSAAPLTLGAEFLLDPPTPLQWKALQESLIVHRNRITLEAQKSTSSEGDDGVQNLGIINAAPIVAFIDEVTGSSILYPSHDKKGSGGRYATIAAVVGIKIKKQRERSFKDDDFMDFYNNIRDKNTISPLDSTVRLLGVGRACLHRFFYMTPNDVDESDDASEEDEYYENEYDEYDEYDNGHNGYADSTPIVMAEFQIVLDDSSFHTDASINDLGQRGTRSPRSSPVHTLNYLYGMVQQVNRAHDRRRRLVLGIKAGFSRLDMNARMRNEALFDDVVDYDGFGILFKSRQDQQNNLTEDQIMDDDLLSILPSDDIFSSKEEDSLNHIKEIMLLDNYGLSYYGSFSRIPDLADVLSKTLQPYYSKEFNTREENEWEVASFVAFRCLEGYVDPSQVAWSLLCTSSIDRLRAALTLMLDHEQKLLHVANYISKKLRLCGEECSDLW